MPPKKNQPIPQAIAAIKIGRSRLMRWTIIISVSLLLFLVVILTLIVLPQAQVSSIRSDGTQMSPTTRSVSNHGIFSNNRRVTIEGYDGNAEEPFLTPDGNYLIFDNRGLSESDTNPDLLYAKRITDDTFVYMGTVKGADSPSPEIMPVMDDQNHLYFNAVRPPDPDKNVNYVGIWKDGVLSNVTSIPGIPDQEAGYDRTIVGVSPNGQTLYFGISKHGVPKYCRASIGVKNNDGTFTELDDGSTDPRFISFKHIFENIYNMCSGEPHGTHFSGPFMLSPDGLEAYFEQIEVDRNTFPPQLNRIYVAKRTSISEPFGAPEEVIGQADGMNEGVFLSHDGRLLYYHHLDLLEGKDPRTARIRIYVMSR